MKWFKHYNNVKTSTTLRQFEDKVGFEGMGRYWRLLEFLSENYDGNTHFFEFNPTTIRELFRIRSWTKLRLYCEHLATIRGLSVIVTENVIQFDAPILLELQSRDFKKARSDRASSAPKNKIKNKIKNKNKNNTSGGAKKAKKSEVSKSAKQKTNCLETTQAKALRTEIWDAYSLGYEAKYGIAPIRNAKINALVMQLSKRLGKQAVEVVKFFLQHDDSFYIKRLHDLALCVKDAEALYTQMKKGAVVNDRNIKKFTDKLDKQKAFDEMLQDAKAYDEQQQALLEQGE